MRQSLQQVDLVLQLCLFDFQKLVFLNDLDGIDLTRTLVHTFLDERECSFTNLRIINNNQS